MEETDNPHLRDILDEAADVPPERRRQLLDRACDGDVSLRAQVEELLALLDEAGDFLTTPTVNRPVGVDVELDDSPASIVRETPGTLVGPYTLMEQLGEGGMGIVFRAEQKKPVRRTVALKIIKPGMDSAVVIGRLEAERQALAMMDHPNIARVYDAGATESGRPYFVMELVEGVPITRYCDERCLTPHERLELFIPVCQALQHAHQKGIIHRDLKPSNLLVMTLEGKPVPKIIDFGVAKALHQKLTEKTLCTLVGHAIGTPQYMSPEQAELDTAGVDTRSDIYSLGVVLYELLTGSTPLDRKSLVEGGYGHMVKSIRDEEPPKPSTRLGSSADTLATICERRGVEPKRLVKLLSGDLDWVVMKCLEKDRSRRYETATGLARDLQRFLDYEPVEACPPSAAYKFRKFARKHRLPLTFAVALAVVLIVAVIVSSWQAVRATLANGRETAQRQRVEAVAELLESIFKHVDPDMARSGGDVLREELLAQLEQTTGELESKYPGEPLTRARLRSAMAAVELHLGDAEKAELLLQDALNLQLKYGQPDDLDTLITMNGLAWAWDDLGRTDEAIALFEKVRDRSLQKLGPNARSTLNTLDDLATAYNHARRYTEAVTLLEQVRTSKAKALGPDDPDTLIAINNLGSAYLSAGRYPDAIRTFEEARDRALKVWGLGHRSVLTILNNLGIAYDNGGRLPEAIELLEQVRDEEVNGEGADNPRTLVTVMNLGIAYQHANRTKDAIELFQRVRDRQTKSLPPDHPSTLLTVEHLASALAQAGQFEDASKFYEQVRQLRIQKLGPENPNTLGTTKRLAELYERWAKHEQALPLWLQLGNWLLGHPQGTPGHEVTADQVLPKLIACYRSLGDSKEADRWSARLNGKQ